MSDVFDRLQQVHDAMMVIAWLERWWWAVALAVAVVALIPRRS